MIKGSKAADLVAQRPGFSEEFVNGIWHGCCPMIGGQGHLRAH